jgi:hypothetical protein
MTRDVTGKFGIYISARNGQIEIVEINSVEEKNLLASSRDAYFSCGLAVAQHEALLTRDTLLTSDDVSAYAADGKYFVHMPPEGNMTDAYRKATMARVEQEYQNNVNISGRLTDS